MKKNKKKEVIPASQFYKDAQAKWDYQINKSYRNLRAWKTIAMISCFITCASIFYSYSHITEPKLLPYVVEVDSSTGSVNFRGMMRRTNIEITDAMIIKHLRDFINDFRGVSIDRVVLTKNLNNAFNFANGEVQTRLQEYIQGSETNPFLLHNEKIRRDISITNYQQTADFTWRVEWTETYRSSGVVVKKVRMSGSFTYQQVIAKTEEQAEKNPVGIEFTYFSVAKIRED